MDKEIEIKRIAKKENQAIYHIIREILESFHLDRDGTAYRDPYLNHLYEFYQTKPKGEYWIIKKRGIVIGGVGIAPFNGLEEVAELQKYYIKKDYQGNGYGALLMKKAIKYAKEQKYKKIYLETMDRLTKANSIYKSFGFKSLENPLAGSEHSLMNRWFIMNVE